MGKSLTYTILTINMMIWGLNTVALKILVQHFTPLLMQGFRIGIAGLVVLLILIAKWKWKKTNPRERIYILGATVFGVVGHHSLLAMGLSKTSATHAALILALVPLTTSLLSFLWLKENLKILRCIGILLGFIGVTFVVANGDGVGQTTWGDAFVFGSMVSQSISFIFIKKATDTLDAKQVTAVMFLVGSISILVLSYLMEPAGTPLSDGSSTVWLLLFGSGIIATGLGHMFYNSAIHQLGPGQTAVFINLTPFFALVGASLFLSEMITWLQGVGFLFIVAGVFLGTGALEGKQNATSKPLQRKTGS
ncbi:DMT family transporter [Kroppenstedtia pulmonis]|uniref:DMT family transporter n=1 Tax=Kroppenstedtia pulmonis TaxID=1380685 RepID=A0A7D4CWX2_9BACL|nr:DMT family transporter [Kroppenstedtia pulmonis]QKG85437.1 DMT family transporter [Kroppenstedtia pulmonis]